jgi:acyl dehydratase
MTQQLLAQRYWEDVTIGEILPTLEFPLSVYRLVVTAGANRDFNAIHHNSEFAKASGAPDMYANTLFLQGMWERAVRDFIGLAGKIHKLAGFRMGVFNTVGDTVHVHGEVMRKWQDNGINYVEIKLWSENSKGISVGPGSMTVSMPGASGTTR